MNDAEINKWAKTYISASLEHGMNTEHPDWWAIERFMQVGTEEVTAAECWKAINAVLALQPPEKVIGVLAAGPLEQLIDDCGEEVIEDIENESRKNPAFKHLLGGVWESGSKEVWARVEACRGEPW